MKKITIIKARIKSISPLHIGNDEGEVLIHYGTNMAYLPATSIAGSFRAYLKTIGEDYKSLFGDQEGNKSIMSSIYISDSFSSITNFEKRDGLRIDSAMGSNAYGSKIDRLYLEEGLEFDLNFEIHAEEDKIISYKSMIYKCLNALDKNHIRFGGKKSSGLGNFRLLSADEIDFDFNKIIHYEKYLKRDYEDAKSIKDEILRTKLDNTFVEFTIEGEFTNPLIIKAPDRFELGEPDDSSLKSKGKYIVPGSSFKGVLRARVEKIADYFGNQNIAEEMFGTIIGNKNKNRLSRVAVNESKVGKSKEAVYHRIKVDSFTGGVRKGSLMDDVPINGKIEFNVIYKKCGDKKMDYYAIGILSLALRDLGMEDLPIGSGSSIGRGRFKASSMSISNGDDTINIDFTNRKIDGEEKLQEYVSAIGSCKVEVNFNEEEA